MPLHESANLFGGFAPFPNTIMIPTMGLQSDVIGFRFGFGYEKGKRTLRAMSNEQFNNLNEEAEQAIYKLHDATAINFFKLELDKWTALQSEIIEKTVQIEMAKAQRTPSATAEVIKSFYQGVSNMGSSTTISWNQLAKLLFGPILSIFIPDKTPETIPDIPTVDTELGTLPKTLPETEPIPTSGGTSTEQPPLIVEPLPTVEKVITKQPWETGAEYRITFKYTDVDGRDQTFSRLLNLTDHKAFGVFLKKRATELQASGNTRSSKNVLIIYSKYAFTHHTFTNIWI